MRQALLVVSALVAGFVGGLLGGRLTRPRDQSAREPVIRARRFELLDETGKIVSYWGIDKDNGAMLAFGSYWTSDNAGRSGGRRNLSPDDPRNQRAVLGVLADSPFLDLRDASGRTRMRLGLSIYEKPILWMADETARSKLWLGIRQSDTGGLGDNDWALSFGDSASIGMATEVRDGKKHVLGFLNVDRGRARAR